MRNDDFLALLKEISDFLKTGKSACTTFVEPISPQEVREALNLSRESFAALIGVSRRTVHRWETGRSQPRGPARVLLRILQKHPKVL